ncbi:translocase [Candidatus Shikimatogenerans silvanidophilus]|uniref:translocase n=1 Tax=Candidatus Shikimatogenerans silvanidophilus TaxID=2782547 RepID=UPI001BA53659|nr:translocase [Candidatus Shikimatogenerans silvanidophilus]
MILFISINEIFIFLLGIIIFFKPKKMIKILRKIVFIINKFKNIIEEIKIKIFKEIEINNINDNINKINIKKDKRSVKKK